MPANQLFADWVATETLTAAKLNQMKNDVAALAGANFTGTLTVNGQVVWHAGNDGAGSGLDADTLAGAPASAFFGAAVKVMAVDYVLDANVDRGAYVAVTANATVTLPPGVDSGWSCRIRHAAGVMNSVRLVGGAGVTIDSFGGLTELMPGRAVMVVSGGSNVWYVDGFVRERTIAVPSSSMALTAFVPAIVNDVNVSVGASSAVLTAFVPTIS